MACRGRGWRSGRRGGLSSDELAAGNCSFLSSEGDSTRLDTIRIQKDPTSLSRVLAFAFAFALAWPFV